MDRKVEQTGDTRRDPRRGRTRRALLDAALELVEKKDNFTALSLRLVARKAGVVPTAFYRHFPDMDALGLALVDESFRTLRQLMRDVRAAGVPHKQAINSSVQTYIRYVRTNTRHFQFVAKERFSGSQLIRNAIRQEIRLFTSELATDLSRIPLLGKTSAEDLQMMASLMVNNMTSLTEQVLDIPAEDVAEEMFLARMAEKQLRLIFLGAASWRSK